MYLWYNIEHLKCNNMDIQMDIQLEAETINNGYYHVELRPNILVPVEHYGPEIIKEPEKPKKEYED